MRRQVHGKMKIAIGTCLAAKGDMDINASQIVDLQFNEFLLMPAPRTFWIFLLLLISGNCLAQKPDTTGIQLRFEFGGKDTSFNTASLKLRTSFNNTTQLNEYLLTVPGLLRSRGFPLASVDSVVQQGNIATVFLYLGRQYGDLELDTRLADQDAVRYALVNRKLSPFIKLSFGSFGSFTERMLQYFENNGKPFASVYLDSIHIQNNVVIARLRNDASLNYIVDSLRVIGNARINKRFLHRYLSIEPSAAYDRSKLSAVDDRLKEITFLTPVQPSDITYLGSGSVLNLYLNQKRASKVNFLIGFLPSGTSGKLQLTGDVNLDLKNLFGNGERILVKWQQLQVKSPRLNLGFNHPYLFGSPYGIDFSFDLFKKDSTFLQVNAQAGVQYDFTSQRSAKLFAQVQSTTLLAAGIDTNYVKQQKRLPPNIDVSAISAGLNYEQRTTDYQFNPRRGSELDISAIVGLKKISRSDEVLSLTDPSFNFASLYDSVKPESYQLRLRLNASRYFPLGTYSVLKTGIAAGGFFSPSVFRNELFQIGGFNLMRGFDEESIYASQFSVATIEYRYLVQTNSYFFAFVDACWVKNRHQDIDTDNFLMGTGAGLFFETKVGLLNISYAIGKRDDVRFNLREASKLHLGYLTYF